jgi:hypothetical protein
MAQHGGGVCGLPQMCVCHIITGDKNRPVVKVLLSTMCSRLMTITNLILCIPAVGVEPTTFLYNRRGQTEARQRF